MKKYLILLLTLVLVLVAFAACDSKERSRDDDDEDETETEETDNSGGTQGSGDTQNSGNRGEGDNEPSEGLIKYNYGDMSEYIVLPDFKNYVFEIEEDSVKQAIGSYLMQSANLIDSYYCRRGHVVEVSYVGYYLDDDGNILMTGNEAQTFDESSSTTFFLGSNLAIADFENGIVGMHIGQEKDIYATFPQDYHATDLAGVRVLFRVVLKNVYATSKYDDDFVKEYFPEYRTTKELEEAFKDEYLLTLIYDYIEQNAEVLAYPTAEYNATNELLEDLAKDWVENYGMTLDQYIYSAYGMTRAEYIESNMKTEMIFYALRAAIGEAASPSVQELLDERQRLIEEYKNQYMASNGMSEEAAIASATEFVEALGDDYIFEAVMYEKIDKVIVDYVGFEMIESGLDYCWEEE